MTRDEELAAKALVGAFEREAVNSMVKIGICLGIIVLVIVVSMTYIVLKS